MNLKTKISAAGEAQVRLTTFPTKSGAYTNLKNKLVEGAFEAGANFALGEVRELLSVCKNALEFYGHGWGEGMPNEIVGMKKDIFGLRARETLKKIDDSGVLTDEMGE